MPWGNGGGRGRGSSHRPNDLEDLLQRSQDKLKKVMPGGGGDPDSLIFLAAVVMTAIFGYAFTFRVDADELGIVLRFGKPVRTEPPGLHFRQPYPIEEVRLPKVTRQNIIEVGMRSSEGSRGAQPRPEESLMLTGDENIVGINLVVFWRIKGATKYLFNIRKPEVTVKEVAESAMRDIVGGSNIQPLLTGARQETEQAVQKLVQNVLDFYGAGVSIDQVQL
jgi:membrane protease subunit HflK